jgi:membrane-bound lytic murein transglycosylase D
MTRRTPLRALLGAYLAFSLISPSSLRARESAATDGAAVQASPSGTAAAEAAAQEEAPGASGEARALIAQSEEEYQRGVEAYRNEEIEQALELFDSAVARLLKAPAHLRQLPEVGEALQELIDGIHALEVESYQERPRREETPVEGLSTLDAFLSPEEAERERRLVEDELPRVSADLPIVVNDKVLALIEAYQTRWKEQYQAGIRRSGRYLAMMRRIFEEEGLPQDLVYMVQVESTFKVSAYSRARAKGLWQFIASTGRRYGLKNNHWVDERSDPEKATRAAARFLRDLHARYGDWYLAMAAYNAGPGKIDRAIRTLKSRDFWRLANSRMLRRETRNYVPAIIASILILKDPERFGFEAEVDPELRYETVEVDSPTELRVLADCAGISVDEVKTLNPELRRLITPPDGGAAYQLKLPPGTSERFASAFAQVPHDQRLTYTQHKVRGGETLGSIAARYRTTVSALMRANGIRNPRRISIGQILTIPVGASGEVYAQVDEEPRRAVRHERGERIVHRVRRGETLYRIARMYRTTIDSIRRWNRMGQSSVLHPGRRLVVYYRTLYGQEEREARSPQQGGGGSVPVGDAGQLLHRVRHGDATSAAASR